MPAVVEVSFIVPILNSASSIVPCIGSIFNQKGDYSFEVILVDNGSSDGGPELIERNWPDIKIVKASPRGASIARNMGAATASGQFYAFIDSDVILNEDWGSQCLHALVESRFDCAQGVIRPVASKKSILQTIREKKLQVNTDGHFNYLSCALKSIPLINTAATMIRSELFSRGELLFDKSCTRCEDTDLSYQLLFAGGHFLAVKKAGATVIYNGSLLKYFYRGFITGCAHYKVRKSWFPNHVNKTKTLKSFLQAGSKLIKNKGEALSLLSFIQCFGELFEAFFGTVHKNQKSNLKRKLTIRNIKILRVRFKNQLYIVAPWVSITDLGKTAVLINLLRSDRLILSGHLWGFLKTGITEKVEVSLAEGDEVEFSLLLDKEMLIVI